MNDPLVPAQEENQKHLSRIIQQTHNKNAEEWNSCDFQFSPRDSLYDSQMQTQQDWSIICQLPLQSKICKNLQEPQETPCKNEQLIAQIMQLPSIQEENKSLGPPSSISSNSQVVDQATVTLNQANVASKVYEEIDTQDDATSYSASLRNFIDLNEKNYHPHVAHMKNLFSRMKEYSSQSLQNVRIYISYMEIKMKQEIESLKSMDQTQSILETNQVQLPYFNYADDDERSFLKHFCKNNKDKKIKVKKFYMQIKQVYEQLLSLWRKFQEKRQRKQKFIEQQIINVIDRIQLQMDDIIKCRLLNEKQKIDYRFISQEIRSPNPYLKKDKYLQLKYLMQKQSSYLKLITDFNGKIIAYMVSLFSKQELQIGKQVQESLTKYINCYIDCYGHQSEDLRMCVQITKQKDNEIQIKNQLADILLTFIPKELYIFNQKMHKSRQITDRLQIILSDFSNFMQNNIFLTTIEMNYDYILFRNEAIWKANRSILQKQQNSLDYEPKQALNASNTSNKSKTLRRSHYRYWPDSKVVIVLSSNYFLHLERQDKIATFQLTDVKISKKGREVVITDRKKGIGGFFGAVSQLGRLQFENNEEVDIFAEKLALALKKLSPP